MKKAPSSPAISASPPPAPGTTLTARWPTLLSSGTRRHSCTDSVGVKLSTLLGSPATEAIISTQSWP
jgi:hypothetical protein